MCEQGFDFSDLTDESAVRNAVEWQLNQWKREQLELKTLLVTQNETLDVENIQLVAGVDISFAKDDYVHACAALIIVSFPDLKVVYQDLQMIHLKSPYIPEYLAFREATFFKEAFDKLKKKSPELLPQVLLIDGNGILHPRGFGVACHVGVLVDLPTVGVAKQLFHVDGLENGDAHKSKITALTEAGSSFDLVGNSGKIFGKALRSTIKSTKPVYVSIGHKIDLDDAVEVVRKCCTYRIPEPVRQADILSREYIGENYGNHVNDCTINWESLSNNFKRIEECAQMMKLEEIQEAQEGIGALQI